jgi:hypothetical protein
MRTPRILPCLALFALTSLLPAQTPPTAYTIIQALQGANAGTQTIYRNGSQVMIETKQPAQPDGTPAHRTLSLYDLKAGVSRTWDPASTPPSCSAGHFSGDWGDPFDSTKEITDGIAQGKFKPAGAETVSGIPTSVYTGADQGMNIKAWLDRKDGLVIKAGFGAPGAAMTYMVDIRSVSLAPPPASVFATLPACAGVKPPPTPAELIADETGDDAANYVNAGYGPGSKNSCSIIIRVVAAKTMAPVARKWQAAIDTTFNVDSPSPYTFGVGDDGTSTFSGGGIHEITSQIHNDMLRIDNPPVYFNLALNVKQPHRGTADTLIYRQCFAPVTMLYYVMKDPTDIGAGADFLYAKSGKNASVPTH